MKILKINEKYIFLDNVSSLDVSKDFSGPLFLKKTENQKYLLKIRYIGGDIEILEINEENKEILEKALSEKIVMELAGKETKILIGF